MRAERTDIDDGFGHWFAGFTDGEGCFALCRQSRGYGIEVRFQIALRDDDRPILEEIMSRTGLGKIHDGVARGIHNPKSTWVVGSKSDVRKLVDIFDCYPLRAKKAADYAIWREAALEWVRVPYQRAVRAPGPTRDWSRLEALRDALMRGRQYAGEAELPPTVIAPEAQLSLGR